MADDLIARYRQIDALHERIKALEAALEPFANVAERFHEATPDTALVDVLTIGPVSVGRFRRARAALSGGKG
jgi:hypothetical protein